MPASVALSVRRWAPGSNDGNQVLGIRVQNQTGSTCLDSRSPDALRLANCDGTTPQQWLWEQGALRAQSLCLSVSPTDTSVPILATCTGAATQNWQLLGNFIVNTGTGNCLTPGTTALSDGSFPMQLQPCNNLAAQVRVLGGNP